MNSKINLDDGCNPELVQGATLTSVFQIPCLYPPKEMKIPQINELVPFDKRKYVRRKDIYIHFYIYDSLFREVIKNPYNFIDEFKEYKGIIGPDNSLYTNAIFPSVFVNTYRNRAITYFLQKNGINVIPNVRWGNITTYSKICFEEKIAFLGIPKNSIVSVGSYGTMKNVDDRVNFLMGFEAMIEELTPKVVLIYGSEPKEITKKYEKYIKFVIYPNWTKLKHEK